MKIKQTSERDCCQRTDLKPVEGCPMHNFNIPKILFCIYCGHRHQFVSGRDAAGSWDYEYVKIPEYN